MLRDVAFWIPAKAEEVDSKPFRILGVQRRMSPSRAKSIGEYIDNEEATFPNAIIVSANFDEADALADEESRWLIEENADGCWVLVIPTARKLASVIDGQHRLEGFRYATKESRKSMQLPCAVFLDLPKAYQANIFATINFNQKRVDKSLAYQLFGYELEEKDQRRWTPNLAALFIARVLNAEASSPFRKHIKLALASSDSAAQFKPNWSISIASVVEGIEKLISSYPARDKNLLLSAKVSGRDGLPEDDEAPLRDLYRQGNDKAVYKVVEDFFRAVSEKLWDSNLREDGFILRTVGIVATFDILRLALLAKCIDKTDSYSSARALLSRLPPFDFKDNYFHASGAGKVRIRNVLGVPLGLVTAREVSADSLQPLTDFLSKYGVTVQ